MKYVSTRNQSVRLRASQAIAQGLARDGGLLTPEVFPKLTPALLEDLRGKTYGQRAVAVMKRPLPRPATLGKSLTMPGWRRWNP